jgi:hypothetical protein
LVNGLIEFSLALRGSFLSPATGNCGLRGEMYCGGSDIRMMQVLLDISGLEDLLAAIGPYSQRHIAHLDRLLCSSFVIDYSLSRLSYISQTSDL